MTPYLKSFLVPILFLLVSSFVRGQFDIPPLPKEQKSVYDEANLLSGYEESALRGKLEGYADSTSTQIVIYTVPTIKGENIGLLAPRWAQKWGVGQADKDNGVFILLADKEREIWIAPGYGVEDKLTAGITGELTRNRIIPEFKRGDYYQGLNKGTDAIIALLEGSYTEDRDFSKNEGFPFSALLPFVIFVIILIILSNRNRRNRGGRGGGRSSGLDLWDIIILSNMGKGGYNSRSSGGGFGGGGFGSGGFGGGFGGGGFSGGGAGGSW